MIVKSDLLMWFTAPPFWLLGNYKGNKLEQELPVATYWVEIETLVATMFADNVLGLKVLVLSLDESVLVIV